MIINRTRVASGKNGTQIDDGRSYPYIMLLLHVLNKHYRFLLYFSGYIVANQKQNISTRIIGNIVITCFIFTFVKGFFYILYNVTRIQGYDCVDCFDMLYIIFWIILSINETALKCVMRMNEKICYKYLFLFINKYYRNIYIF